MAVKTSVSLTDQQAAFARRLIEEGRYPGMSAVIQQALEQFRSDVEETDAFRAWIAERQAGPFLSQEEFDHELDRALSRKMRARGVMAD